MTKRIGNVVMLEDQGPQQCDLCGEIDELRPYGPKGEKICFDCGMKNPKATAKAFAELLGLEPDSAAQAFAEADLIKRREAKCGY